MANPALLLTLPISAYNATLAVDADDTIYLLAQSAVYRVEPGEIPQATPVELSYGATLTRSAILYWSRGAAWKLPKRGGKARRVAALPHQPQYFLSSGDEFAWVDRAEDGAFAIGALNAGVPQTAYASSGKIDAAAMLHDWVFFVERAADDRWRIGAVPIHGGAAAFTSARSGRSPSMLATWEDVYFYDGNSRDVRRLSPDLQREETVAEDFICSPIAVAHAVYCTQVDGLYALRPPARTPQLLARAEHGLITTVAAGPHTVAWLDDAGADQLALRAIRR